MARYAVRNNQRNFLKITLPPGATLWSASLGGKAVRPGQSPDGSPSSCPLDKARAGEEAPEFAGEVVYLSRGAAWNDKGQVKLALPALDLPVSRTGLLVYHPPLFRVTPEPGAFRTEPYENPISSALNPPATLSGGLRQQSRRWGPGRSVATVTGHGFPKTNKNRSALKSQLRFLSINSGPTRWPGSALGFSPFVWRSPHLDPRSIWSPN